MEVAASAHRELPQTCEGLGDDTVRNLVHRHILRTTVQALIGAEWKRLKLALTGESKHSSDPRVIKKVGTKLGKIRIEFPHDNDLKFRSCVLCASQRDLNIPIEKLLVLPFVDDESSLRAAMIEIFGDQMPADLTRLFINALTELLQCDQDGKLEETYAIGYFGSHNVVGRSGNAGDGLIDYCILRDSRGHHFVAGIWDPLNGDEARWLDIAAALKKRGVRTIEEVRTDGSNGSGLLSLKLMESKKEKLMEDTNVYEMPIEANERRWEGRQSDPLFDPPQVEQVFVAPAPEPQVEMSDQHYESARFSLVKDVMIAISGALVLTLIVVCGFQYAAHSFDFGAAFDPAKLIFLSPERSINDAGGVSPKSAALISAIETGGEMDDPAVRKALLSLSEHRDYRVRIAVIRALAVSEGEASAERLQFLSQMLTDSDYLVRGFAAKTLGQLGTPAALNVLRARVSQEDNKVVLAVMSKLLRQ